MNLMQSKYSHYHKSCFHIGTQIDVNCAEDFRPIRNYINNTGATIRHGNRGKANNGSSCYYHRKANFIRMFYPHYFNNADCYYRVLFHEIGHWAGVNKGKNNIQLDFLSEEVVAELVAFSLCVEFGVQFDTAIIHVFLGSLGRLIPAQKRIIQAEAILRIEFLERFLSSK
jgi:antirestriction protein ArdC